MAQIPASPTAKSIVRNIVFFLSVLFGMVIQGVSAQQADAEMLRSIYTASLTEGKAYDWLNHLSNQIGGRLSGSVQAQQAVDYTRKELEQVGLDKVWLQPVMVPKWELGTAEFDYIESEPGNTNTVPVCALG